MQGQCSTGPLGIALVNGCETAQHLLISKLPLVPLSCKEEGPCKPLSSKVIRPD